MKKKRQTMEKIFFHDLKNLLGGLNGWTELLKLTSTDTAVSNIATISRRLNQEIQGQYLIGQALEGALKVHLQNVSCQKMFEDLRMIFGEHPAATGKVFLAKDPPEDLIVNTDPEILERILINMVKNGLEASQTREIVTLSCDKVSDILRFSVHSSREIPRDIVPHIFEKSFTTSGDPGRGLGCFAIKYLGELFLGGKVGFDTGPDDGTTFWIELPIL